jgi:branched-chain amino acid transport system ATP-binding protein
MLLEVRRLEAGYGAVQVLWGVSLAVDAGEIVSLIGNNGAGKSTCLATIAGLVRPWGGEDVFADRAVTGRPPAEMAELGLALVPQGRRLFGAMSVEDNLLMGAYLRRDRGGIAATLADCYRLFPRLRERRRQAAGTLSGGEQQMVAIARGLMARPRLLCIDELSLGLAPAVTAELLEVLVRIRGEGTAVLLVEQDVENALEVADRAYVMEGGRIVLQGTATEVRQDPGVRAAYLGL